MPSWGTAPPAHPPPAVAIPMAPPTVAARLRRPAGRCAGRQAYNPYGQAQPQAADTAPPRVEVQLSDPAPYIQQGVMLTLRLLSGSNLAEANPELPSAGAIMVRSLGDPGRASGRWAPGVRSSPSSSSS